MARKQAYTVHQYPIGTVVEATCVITDNDGEIPRIVARPGDLGIVTEYCGSVSTHEVVFPGGSFTSAVRDPAVKLYAGKVSTVCDGQPCHPTQKL